MEKQELIKFLDNIFTPIGFKRKGNNWIINGEEISKIINLQKSQYSNSYYINYGYIIKKLPLNGFVNHVDNRLSSKNELEYRRIVDLLDLEFEISPEERFSELEKLIRNKIISQIESTNNEQDILKILKEKEFLYMIPPNVLEHFNLKVED